MPAAVTAAVRGTGGAERPLSSKTLKIREVWADNLEEEMQIINEVVEEFNYLAMDTEFPGVARARDASPLGVTRLSSAHFAHRARAAPLARL